MTTNPLNNQTNQKMPNIIIPNPLDNAIEKGESSQIQKLNNDLKKILKDLENTNLNKESRKKLTATRNALEEKIENMKDDSKINKNTVKRSINKDIRGVEVYVHGKPYPDYTYPGYNRPENYIHKVQFRVIGNNDPYALVDENLRQLKKYNENDVLNLYDDNGNLNIDKKNPDEFNTYAMKKILILPNTEKQSGAGKKKYKKIKRKSIKNKKTNKKYPKKKRKTRRK